MSSIACPVAMPRMTFANPRLSELLAGKIPADLCFQVGDVVRATRGSSGYFVITAITPALFDYDYWAKHGSSDYYYYYIRTEKDTGNCTFANPRQYFSHIEMTKIATKTMKPLKKRRKGFGTYVNKVEYTNKQMLLDELDKEVKRLKDEYNQLINIL